MDKEGYSAISVGPLSGKITNLHGDRPCNTLQLIVKSRLYSAIKQLMLFVSLYSALLIFKTISHSGS